MTFGPFLVHSDYFSGLFLFHFFIVHSERQLLGVQPGVREGIDKIESAQLKKKQISSFA